MNEFLNIGKIINTHGVKGEVKVFALTDDPQRFEDLKNVIIEKNGVRNTLSISSVKYIKNTVIVKFAEINTMEGAEALKESMVIIDRKDAIKLPKDRFFICDIIGCEVYDGEMGLLGKIDEVLQTGSNDVYIVKGHKQYREILVPALKTVVKKVDLEARRIDVKLPEGLLDD